jgi:hypothetical protein
MCMRWVPRTGLTILIALTMVTAGVGASASAADADTLTATPSGPSTDTGVPLTLTFAGSDSAFDSGGDTPYLYEVVRRADGVPCQASFGQDLTAAGNDDTSVLVNGNEVQDGTFTDSETYTPSVGAWLVCAWLETDSDDGADNNDPATDVTATATTTFDAVNADTLGVSLSSSTPVRGRSMTLTFAGSDSAFDSGGDTPYLYEVVRRANGVPCQASFGQDQTAAGNDDTSVLVNGNEVQDGTFTDSETYTPSVGAWLVCAWLETDSDDGADNNDPATDVTATATTTFTAPGASIVVSGWQAAVSHGAGPLGSGPTAGADSAGGQFVFWEGAGGTLWDEWYTNSSWHGPAQITTAGKTLRSAPAVAVLPSGHQDVFWRGTGGNLYETTHTSHWTARMNLGAGPMGSGPTADADASGGVFVFWEGTDGTLWDKWRTGGRWHGPAKIKVAGRMGSAPAVAVQRSGVQNVFWRGRDGDLWDAWHTSAWHGPVNLGAGPLGSAPTAGADAQGNLFVFWKGTDGSLWDRWKLGSTWHGPAKITAAGKMGSAPAVAVHGDGEQDVFWRGTDGNLWETRHS